MWTYDDLNDDCITLDKTPKVEQDRMVYVLTPDELETTLIDFLSLAAEEWRKGNGRTERLLATAALKRWREENLIKPKE